MFLRTLLVCAVIGLSTTSALAHHCPKDAAAIDGAMSRMTLDDATRAKVQSLRDEGMALHTAGNHEESEHKLAEAMRMLLEAK